MPGELTSQSSKQETIRGLMVKYNKELQAALPMHMRKDWERFVRIALTAMSRNPVLYECSPRSLFGALIQCAQLGLEPDDVRGHAYLVPFKVQGTYEVVLIPGYKGLMDLARRSGEIGYIKAEVVYSKDIFTYSYGSGEKESYEHIPTTDLQPGELVYAYAKAHYTDGTEQFTVLNKRQVNERMNKSASVRAGRNSPWSTDTEAMWRKSAVRALATFLPSSAEAFHRAVGLEERAEANVTQGLADLAPPELEETKKPLDNLTEKLKRKPREAKPKQEEAKQEEQPPENGPEGPPASQYWPPDEKTTTQKPTTAAEFLTLRAFGDEIATYSRLQMVDNTVLSELLGKIRQEDNTAAIVVWNKRRAEVMT